MSLLEIIIALVIVSLVFLSLFDGLHQGYQGTERLSEESYLQNHAISLLEALSLVPYSKLPEIPEGTEEAELVGILAGVPEFRFPGTPDPDATRFVEVVELSQRGDGPLDPVASPLGALKRISVEVWWQPAYLSPDAPPRRITFRLLVTDDMEVSRR